jgi:ABC-type transport system involved in cytochrome bd biosynthesis fused ATPase/permease subunit
VALLAAEFFIPMRLIGSYFHTAMNGVAASEKILAILDLPETPDAGRGLGAVGEGVTVRVSGLGFSYEGARAPALSGVGLELRAGGLTALVGESGCGKSTLARILSGALRGYVGSAILDVRTGVAVELRDIARADLMRCVTLVGSNSHIFTGSVRDNLALADPGATDDEMWDALRAARLADFLASGRGLDTPVSEGAANLSGGQRQRLAIARALMRDTQVYVFDEATSNIDAESEGLIMDTIAELARQKTVLLISHRLANVTGARVIRVMERGRVVESGTHGELLYRGGAYARMYEAQMVLESAAFAGPGAEMEAVNG